MPIRDLIIAGIVFGSLPVTLARPFVGVVVWSWLGFMNPQRLTWGFAYDMEFSAMVAAATLMGLLFTKDRAAVPGTRETYLLLGFWAVAVASSIGGLYPEYIWEDLKRLSKILLMVFVTIMLSQTRERVHTLLLVAAVSIGFFGLKGGLWALATGGESGYVLGPEGSFIGDNNGLALGLNMTLPILFFLAWEEKRSWLRAILWAMFAFSVVAIPFTYSRGGFLALVVVLTLLMTRTRFKWMIVPLGAVGAMVLVSFLPERFFDRINTIATYTEDGSAMSRIYAWRVGWGLALDYPILGGGFRVFPHPEIWQKYVPDWPFPGVHNAHSIYFQTLGELGFTGFFCFFGMLGCTLLSLHTIRKQAAGLRDGGWLVNYAFMVETSLLAYLIAGAFYNLGAFDLVYFLVAMTIVMRRLLADELAAQPTDTMGQTRSVPTMAVGGGTGLTRLPVWNMPKGDR
jgi:probable O-glycosylation ligase (exosortase A-associated)